MVTKSGFYNWAGWPLSPQKASGLLVLSRKDPASQTIIQIPAQTNFRVLPGGINFQNSEALELNESTRQLEIAVTAVQDGSVGNIPGRSVWLDPQPPGDGAGIIRSLSVENPAGFTGGADEIPTSNMADALTLPSITQANVQMHLDSSMSIVLDLLGYDRETESLPDDSRVDIACYLLCLFLIENRSSQEKIQTLTVGPMKGQTTNYFRSRLEPAIYKRIVSLISPWRRHTAFMPNPEVARA